MSTIQTAIDALLTSIQAASADFTAANTVAYDWQVLDASSSAGGYACVVEMARPTREGDDLDGRGEIGTYQEAHYLKATVAVKVGTGAAGYVALIRGLQAEVEEIKDYVRAHNRLGLTSVVSRAQSIETGIIKERVVRSQSPSPTHFLQEITFLVYCEAAAPDNDGGGW